MKILVLGGTIFVGRAFVEAAIHDGHDVWIYHRGKHPADFSNRINEILGDREGDLAELNGQYWDAVVDVSGYWPQVVGNSARFLRQKAGHYLFVSTISVYAENFMPSQAESAELVPPIESAEALNGETYGGLKVRCESIVRETWGDDSLIIRPGLIVGPFDPTDRYSYWIARVQQGGEVAAPGNPFQNVQFIDVRDLATWMLMMVTKHSRGTYNATGPASELNMSQFLDICSEVLSKKINPVWLSEEFLLQKGIRPFVDMPLWVPAESAAFNRVNITRATQTGLFLRPVDATIRDTANWLKTGGKGIGGLRAGLDRRKEEELLRDWKTSTQC